MVFISFASLAAGPPKPPNFIIILCDDLGYGDVGAFGATRMATPNIDRMASKGITLTNFYASANVCTPSRAGLLTGRYSIRMGLAKGVLFPHSPTGLPDSEITIAQALKEKGYHSALIGKWHLGDAPEFQPRRRGFDYFYGLLYSHDMTPLPLYRNEERIEESADMPKLTERYTQEAIQYIEQNKGGPFFLYLAHSMPHIPLAVSERFKGKSKAGLYGDVVQGLDWSVGEILAALKRLNLERNTLVIFTSDNGPWYEGSAGPFRQRKGESWEGGMRVPFIARWPGKIPAGKSSGTMASNLDFLPTLLTLAGITIPNDRPIDGGDISKILFGGKPDKDFAMRPFYMFNNEEIAAVRSGKWKYVVQSRYINSNVNFEKHPFYRPGMLFDLSTDPEERFNLSRDNPNALQKMIGLTQKGRDELMKTKGTP